MGWRLRSSILSACGLECYFLGPRLWPRADGLHKLQVTLAFSFLFFFSIGLLYLWICNFLILHPGRWQFPRTHPSPPPPLSRHTDLLPGTLFFLLANLCTCHLWDWKAHVRPCLIEDTAQWQLHICGAIIWQTPFLLLRCEPPWYWWNYLQGRNREWTCGHGDRGGRGWAGLRERHWRVYMTVCKIDSRWEAAKAHKALSSELCDDLEGWDGGGRREAREGGDVCIYRADPLCHAETSPTL